MDLSARQAAHRNVLPSGCIHVLEDTLSSILRLLKLFSWSGFQKEHGHLPPCTQDDSKEHFCCIRKLSWFGYLFRQRNIDQFLFFLVRPC